MPAYWELLADRLAKGGWSYGVKSGLYHDGRRVYVVDGHRDDGHRYVGHVEPVSEQAIGEVQGHFHPLFLISENTGFE